MSTSSLLENSLLENCQAINLFVALLTNIFVDGKVMSTVLFKIFYMFPIDPNLVDMPLWFFEAINSTSVGSLVDAPLMLDH